MSFSPIHSRSPVRRGPSPAGVEEDRSNINTIFVGNLAPDSDERSLREFFGKYGYVTQVKVGSRVLHFCGERFRVAVLIHCPTQRDSYTRLCHAGGHGSGNWQT